MFETVGAVAVIGLIAVVALAVLLIVLLRSYRIASPSQALIITGRGATGDDLEGGGRVVIGGRAVVYPVVQRAFVLSLSSRQIQVEIDGISMNGIAMRLRGVAQVKVGGTVDDVRKAAQRFLDQQEQIDHYSQEILSGTLRAVVGTLTIEQIIQDRASFAAQVQKEAEHSMNNQGLVIDTFQISAVEDDGSYLRDWGRPQAAFVAKEAAIAEANANREAAVAEALQSEETQRQQALTDQAIAEQQQTLALRRAELKEEADRRLAIANAAGPLAEAEQKMALIDRDQRLATERANLRAEELQAEVSRPADAERYRIQTEAEAAKSARILESEANLQDERNRAEAQRLRSEADAFATEARGRAEAEVALQRRSKEAEAVRLEGRAQAEALQARGEAEAAAIAARGTAEADSARRKAEAFKHFNDAAVISQVLEVLPGIAEELARPYSNIKDLSIVSTDGEAKIGKGISSNLAQVLEMVRGTTGLDLGEALQDAIASRSGGGDPDAREPE